MESEHFLHRIRPNWPGQRKKILDYQFRQSVPLFLSKKNTQQKNKHNKKEQKEKSFLTASASFAIRFGWQLACFLTTNETKT